jgi:hypothetical protein
MRPPTATGDDALRNDLNSVYTELSGLKKSVTTLRANIARVHAELNDLKTLLIAIQHQPTPESIPPKLEIPIEFKTHFVQPTNEMNRLLAQAEAQPEQEKRYLTDAATIACRTLNELSDEPDYLRIFRASRDERAQYMPDFEAITGDPIQFGKFVLAEYKLLIACELDKGLADNILQECFNVVKAVQTGQVDPLKIDEAVNILHDKACSLAKSLKKQAQEEKISARTKRILRMVLVGGVGAVIMSGANTLALAIPYYGQAFSNASSAMAGGLAGVFCGLVTIDTDKGNQR